ncbi:MAG TPA: homoserine kinase [Firmicutes bacterium]|nr:homoserine kinase [Bacillota bacterium]
MRNWTLRVSVPASTANLGPGFDAVGLALDLFNVLEVEPGDGEFRVDVLGEGAGLPLAENLAARALQEAFRQAGQKLPPLRLRQTNRIPMGSGMGSSAAAVVGGLVLANALLGDPWPGERLLEMACELEGHPDNVAPALWGGLVVSCRSEAGIRFLRLEAPTELHAVLVVPEFVVSTARARQLLPEEVPFPDAVFNLGRTALLVGALVSRRYDLLREAMQDRLHQPYRAPLVPGMEEALEAAREAGALGAALSGSGPSLLAFAVGDSRPIAEAMQVVLARHGVESTWMTARPTAWGALATLHRR